MIESFMTSTPVCKILRRQTDSVDDSYEPTYTPSDAIDYIFKGRISYFMRRDLGEDAIIDGMLITKEEVLPVDRILLGDYEYDIVEGGIFLRMQLFTNEIEYYAIAISRRRIQNEAEVTITSKVN